MTLSIMRINGIDNGYMHCKPSSRNKKHSENSLEVSYRGINNPKKIRFLSSSALVGASLYNVTSANLNGSKNLNESGTSVNSVVDSAILKAYDSVKKAGRSPLLSGSDFYLEDYIQNQESVKKIKTALYAIYYAASKRGAVRFSDVAEIIEKLNPNIKVKVGYSGDKDSEIKDSCYDSSKKCIFISQKIIDSGNDVFISRILHEFKHSLEDMGQKDRKKLLSSETRETKRRLISLYRSFYRPDDMQYYNKYRETLKRLEEKPYIYQENNPIESIKKEIKQSLRQEILNLKLKNPKNVLRCMITFPQDEYEAYAVSNAFDVDYKGLRIKDNTFMIYNRIIKECFEELGKELYNL